METSKIMKILCGLTVLLAALAVAQAAESTPEFQAKLNDKCCNAVGNKICQEVFQVCMTPSYGLIPYFEQCSLESGADFSDPPKIFTGFCKPEGGKMADATKKALKCMADKLVAHVGGKEEAVLKGIEICEEAVKQKCKVPV